MTLIEINHKFKINLCNNVPKQCSRQELKEESPTHSTPSLAPNGNGVARLLGKGAIIALVIGAITLAHYCIEGQEAFVGVCEFVLKVLSLLNL